MDERIKAALAEWFDMLGYSMDGDQVGLHPIDSQRMWGCVHQVWSEMKAVNGGDWDRYEMLRGERYQFPPRLRLDERVRKVWADELFRQFKRDSIASQLMRKYDNRPPPTRIERLRGWLWWKSYRIKEYFRNLGARASR